MPVEDDQAEVRGPFASYFAWRGKQPARLIAAEAFDSGLAFVRGSNSFVESIGEMLLAAGYGPERTRTERFGPTGWNRRA